MFYVILGLLAAVCLFVVIFGFYEFLVEERQEKERSKNFHLKHLADINAGK